MDTAAFLDNEEGETDADDGPLIFAAHRLSPRERYGMRLLFFFIFWMVMTALVLGPMNVKALIPFKSSLLLLIVPAPFALLSALFFPFPQKWHEARLYKDRFELVNDTGEHEQILKYADPVLIAGLSGISLDGGELLVWKCTKIKTRNAVYVLQMDPAANAACYDALVRRCDLSIGISCSNEIRVPELIGKSASIEVLVEVLDMVVQEFRKHFWEAAIATIAWAILSLCLTAIGIGALMAATSTAHEESAAKVIVSAIIGLAATLTSGYLAWKKLKLYRRFERLRQTSGNIN